MAMDGTMRRRCIGGLALLAALGMLIAGETVLKSRLGAAEFLFYWLLCFGFTATAIVVAFLDVQALQRRTRQEQKDLLDSTLRKIESEARSKKQPAPRSGSATRSVQPTRRPGSGSR